jgi:hypothetical protein
VPSAARHIVTSEEELGAIVRLLDAPELLPHAAVLRGEAGIGKTAVWLGRIVPAIEASDPPHRKAN